MKNILHTPPLHLGHIRHNAAGHIERIQGIRGAKTKRAHIVPLPQTLPSKLVPCSAGTSEKLRTDLAVSARESKEADALVRVVVNVVDAFVSPGGGAGVRVAGQYNWSYNTTGNDEGADRGGGRSDPTLAMAAFPR